MAKRGETRPHRLRFTWSNGVKGTETFIDTDRLGMFLDRMKGTAARREMTVEVEYTHRVTGETWQRSLP
jgi:hypothetical protein